MKKRACVMVVCVLAILMVGLAPALAPASDLPKFVRFASLSVGMSAYYTAVGIGSVMSKHSPIKVAVDPVGMHAAVFGLIEKGEADMGAIGSIEAVPAWRGEKMYKGKRKPILAGMTTIRMYFTVHTTPKTGIKRIEDLRGKRVMNEYPPAPSVKAYSDALLKAHGMTSKDIKGMRFGTWPEAVAALIEGRTDAICHPSSLKGMQQIKMAVGHRAVPIAPGPAKKMLDMLLGFKYEPMPKGYNRVVEKDTPALAYYTIIFFHENVPDKVAYTLVKAALDHHKEYARVHPLLPEVDAVRGAKVVGIAFHPGAIKYFKEKGLWTAEHEKMNTELLAKYKR